MRQYAKHLIIVMLAGTLEIGTAGAQVAPAPSPNLLTDSNATETRDQLTAVLNQYPPTVSRVLQIDPNLLTNKDYLAPYPALSTFLVKHPEILHNASFFLGQPRGPGFAVVDRSEDRAARDIAEFMTIASVFISVIVAIAWITGSLIDYRRWLRASKSQSEIQSRLMDRLTSSQDLLAFIQSPAGRSFIEAAPVADAAGTPGVMVRRILSSVQAGLVIGLGGIGLYYASYHIATQAAQPFFVLGVLGMSLGAGFILSAVASYVISRNLGLVRGTSEAAQT
jgi:hypothetical protein